MGRRAKAKGVYIPNRDLGDLCKCARCGQLVFNTAQYQELHDAWHAGLELPPTGLEGKTDAGDTEG